MSELPCFRCSRDVPPKRATHTRDGKVACPSCTKELGMRTVPLEGFMEVTRMRTREQIEAQREKAKKLAEDAKNSNPQGEVELHERTVTVLEWVLGEDDTKPTEAKKREDHPEENH